MAKGELARVRKSFGATMVIAPLDLAVPDDEFCVLVGPSGCGTYTLLRRVVGLETADAGRIRIGGRDVTCKEPSRCGLVMVSRSYAHDPNMTVAQNMECGLEMAGIPRDRRRAALESGARALRLGASSTASRGRCRAASANASPSAAPSCPSPTTFRSTSRCRN